MEGYLAEHAPDVAFYSEDRGMVNPGGEPRWVLVVDPIDGTRPALAGFESACVSVAAAPLDGEPTMADVEVGCVVEIKSGERFLAVRGVRGRAGAAAVGADEHRADAVDLRLPRPAGGRDDDRARGAARRLVGGGRHVRPRLGHLRHDPARHRPARRLRRAGAADDRRDRLDAGRVRAGRPRRRPQQLPLRPRRRRPDPRRGRRGRHRRLRQPPRRPPAARLRARLPDVLRLRRQRRAPRGTDRRARRRHRAAPRQPVPADADSGADRRVDSLRV